MCQVVGVLVLFRAAARARGSEEIVSRCRMWLSLPGTVSRGNRAPTGVGVKVRLFGWRVGVQRGVNRQQSVGAAARVLHERVALLFALLLVPVCCHNTNTHDHLVAGSPAPAREGAPGRLVTGSQVAGSVLRGSSTLRGGVFGRAHGELSMHRDRHTGTQQLQHWGRRSLVADECGWERHSGYFMSDFAKHPGQVHHAVFNNLAEAQADCIAIGEGCKGVTCTDSGECTVRNHEHLRVSVDHKEDTLVKTGCPGGFVPGSLGDDGSGGQLWTTGAGDALASTAGSSEVNSDDRRKNTAESTEFTGAGSTEVVTEEEAVDAGIKPTETSRDGAGSTVGHGAHGLLPQARPGKAWHDRQAPRLINTHREIL